MFKVSVATQAHRHTSVSYTHLDVYKRQEVKRLIFLLVTVKMQTKGKTESCLIVWYILLIKFIMLFIFYAETAVSIKQLLSVVPVLSFYQYQILK